jgi:hypothetical protein
VSAFFVEPTADQRLDEIYDYTAGQWGEDQADRYIQRLSSGLPPLPRSGCRGVYYLPISACPYISRGPSSTSSIGANGRMARSAS